MPEALSIAQAIDIRIAKGIAGEDMTETAKRSFISTRIDKDREELEEVSDERGAELAKQIDAAWTAGNVAVAAVLTAQLGRLTKRSEARAQRYASGRRF